MKGIEIPFRAKDSELGGWEYTIPEGMEAVVEGGKVIVRRKESEDERIRRDIIHYILYKADGVSEEQEHSWIAYLEKQKEQKPAEWSEEGNAMLKVAIAVLRRYSHDDVANWLKSLPERFNLQPKQKWNEEDEKIRRNLM